MKSSARDSLLLTLLLAAAVALATPAIGAAAKKPPPPPAPPPTSTTTAFIKNFADIVNGVEASATPVDVQPTADGGSITLALVPSPSSVGVSWVTKVSSTGAIQWQEEVGCLATPPGDYSDGASLQGTKDGGYVIAGGTIGCGGGGNCPATSGASCGLVEKLTSSGAVSWARVYSIGADETSFHGVRETPDGGFIAVGSATDASRNNAGLIAKLDASGNLLWQSQYTSPSSSPTEFESVALASDGGYVATGRVYAAGYTLTAVEFTATGGLVWQHAYNNLTNGSPSSSVQPLAISSTRDGGYAIAGTWNSTTGPGTCCSGPLLLKLDTQGSIQWQQAYEGGVYCFATVFEQCVSIGGIAYGLQQTKDGGFVLAGASNIEMADGAPLEPWLARVDANGQLIWQENDYRVNPQTGRPLSENFAGIAITGDQFFAIGATENLSNGAGELLGVATDGDGHVALSCADEHSTALLSAADPGLVDIGALGVSTTSVVAGQSVAPVQTLATGGTASPSQC